jgi:hypothetical protein
MRGPHDDEIEDQHPEKDHARERLDEFLKRREPNVQPEERENHARGKPLRKSNPKSDPKSDPKR